MRPPNRRIRLMLLDHLDRHGPSSVDSLAVLVFGETAWWSRRRVMESLRILERRGLVRINGGPRPSGRRVAERTGKERPSWRTT